MLCIITTLHRHQLAWHPHRRLLAAALPDHVLLFELGAPARDGSVSHGLPLPERLAGAILGCCWADSGGVEILHVCPVSDIQSQR